MCTYTHACVHVHTYPTQLSGGTAPNPVQLPTANGSPPGTATNETSTSLGEQSRGAPSQNRAREAGVCLYSLGWSWGPWPCGQSPGPALPQRAGQEALSAGTRQKAAKEGRRWERDTDRGRAQAAGGEAVGSDRLDSCHVETASGLTASRARRLCVAAAVLWKSPARVQHRL